MTTRINAARKAIGDSGEEQRLIRTVARKGFRFVGIVTSAAANVSDAPASDVATLMPYHSRRNPRLPYCLSRI